MATPKKIRDWHYDRVLAFQFAAAADAVDQSIFIADRGYDLVSFEVVYGAAVGSACTLDLKKCTGTTAPASGTTMLSSTANLNTTVNTVQSVALSATEANTQLADGDRLALDFSAAGGSLAGLAVTVVLRPTDLTSAD